MRSLAVFLLLALALCAVAHAHCVVEDCTEQDTHSRAEDPLCENEQVCMSDDRVRISAPLQLVPPAPLDSAIRVPAFLTQSFEPGSYRLIRKAPDLSLLQSFLI